MFFISFFKSQEIKTKKIVRTFFWFMKNNLFTIFKCKVWSFFRVFLKKARKGIFEQILFGLFIFLGVFDIKEIYIFEIYVKFCIFDVWHDRIQKNFFLGPLLATFLKGHDLSSSQL
jgi:hypothetical protein